MKNNLFLFAFCCLCLPQLTGQVLHVPAQYPSIQAAINNAQDGDTVLVQPGEYFENLRFRGKAIVLSSRFFQTGAAQDIANTIINGSQPDHPDTASCILIVDGEGPGTVVQGFTITGGKGTRWFDPHGAGTFTEGGGILAEGSSPTIQFNIIHHNVITNTLNVVSNGGGGIRCGDGNPIIRNNWIHHNVGRYGGGIVLNYCTGQIANNLISYNEGGQDFGGAGLWFTGTDHNTVVEVYNNTIVNNHATGSGAYGGKGGGVFVFSIQLNTRNNIIWGNTQTSGGPIAKLLGGAVMAAYSDIQDGYAGTGNFNQLPLFADSIHFALYDRSPCIDAGSPESSDLAANNTLVAAFPSHCSLAADLGTFGGAGASVLPFGVQAITRLLDALSTGPLVAIPSDSRSVNFVDVNNDGWEDVFFTNGPEAGGTHLLYLNTGHTNGAVYPHVNFNQVTSGDIVANAKPFDGATFGDIDNDGDLDAFAVTWYGQTNDLYLGNGDGSFDYAATALPSNQATYSETASWGDYDLDDDLDLYITNSEGDKKNTLYRNDGGGLFTKINTGAHVLDAKFSRSVNWVDYDNDDDPDLFVTNESNQTDDLYRNEGNGAFTKITGNGSPGQVNRSGMSSSWGDVDNDGDLDLFIANSAYFAPQNNQLYINEGGSFTEVTTGQLVSDGGCSFGSNFGDYDNDADLDLVVSNGFCNGQIVNFLYKNDGQGHFSRDLSGAENLNTPCSYGAAWGDVNNDGFLDLGIATCKNSSAAPNPPNLFYLNRGNCNNWLKVKLTGTQSNRSGIGAKVWVKALVNGQEITQKREISAQSGYCGQNSLIAHFGLADAAQVLELRVKFAGGRDTTLTDIEVNQQIEVTEALVTGTHESVPEEEFECLVSPNPAFDTFQISLRLERPASGFHLRLMDMKGRIIQQESISLQGQVEWSNVFSAAQLNMPAGQYLAELSSPGLKTKTLTFVLVEGGK